MEVEQNNAGVNHQYNAEMYAKKVNSSRTLEDLIENSECFGFDKDTRTLFCLPCHEKFGMARGRFQCGFTGECDFSSPFDRDEFAKLKYKMKIHVCKSDCHKEATGTPVEKGVIEEVSNEDHEAGMNVGTIAYNCVKLETGYRKFEDFVRVAAARDQAVGDINHSEKLPAALNHQYYVIWKEHMKREFSGKLLSTGKPHYFSVVADKATPHSDTLHVVGLIFPYKDKLEPYFIGLVDNKSGTGEVLAEEIYDCLLEFFTADEIRTR